MNLLPVTNYATGHLTTQEHETINHYAKLYLRLAYYSPHQNEHIKPMRT